MHKQATPTISAVILTLNEASTVARAIESLSWCEKVFVVDSASTDETCEIAAAMGAHVVVHKQSGPFLISTQRNWALENLPITSEWILFLDADEESTDEFKEAVCASLSSPQGKTSFFVAPALMYYGTWLRRIGGYPNWHPRIVKNKSTSRFSGGVWESFAEPRLAGHIATPYIHRTNVKGLEDWLGKHVRYAAWEGNQIIERRSESGGYPVRRNFLRRIRYGLGPLRKYFAFFYLGLLRGGVLDGKEGRSYLRRMFIYELLIDEYVKETTTLRNGGEL